ncbi:MAG: D-2-hydroxyacid dehydrogenase [Clostridia bacterium]|nr:D-2-hydroxyacid dehydrogenase [Clostridia bacterium]
MKITVLDMDTASIDGDISLDGLAMLGELRVFGQTGGKDTVALIGDSDAVVCNKTRITREVMEGCPSLRYVGLMGTGFDQVDIAAADELGVTVCNVPSYSSDAVAQHTFGLILNHFGRIAEYTADCASGGWTRKQYFSVFGREMHELAGKTVGLIGCGGIGRKVAKIADAFGMKVLAYNRDPERIKDIPYITGVPLERLLRESDVVSLHCPLNDSTRELINSRTLSMMKPTALLVNTSRGGVINEADLAAALRDGVIAAAAVDVLTEEPMSDGTPLRKAKNIVFTPHIAWAPVETRIRVFEIVAENLKAYAEGRPQNAVHFHKTV